nr:uncharacterized protein LOC129152559 [Nothobranchius furzeri]
MIHLEKDIVNFIKVEDKFKHLEVHVRGLKSTKKIKQVMTKMKDLEAKIFFLQETHLLEEEHIKVGRRWQGGCERCYEVLEKVVYSQLTEYMIRSDILEKFQSSFKPVHMAAPGESWLQQEDYVSLKESTPSNYLNHHIARSTGRGGGVATIFHSDLLISPLQINSYSSFEHLILSFPNPDCKTVKPLLFVVLYRPPGPYSEFLDQISDFLSDLVLNTDKVIVVGDFNIHVDIEKDCLNVAFSNILDSIGFTQRIHSSTHSCHHTLDLVLTYGIECEEITIFPHSPVLSDHFLITFEFFITEFSRHENKFHYSRSLSDNAVASVKSTVPSLLSSASQRNVAEGNIFSSSPSQIDALVHHVKSSLRVALDDVSPLKKKVIRDRKLAPWFNSHLRALKQNSRKLERTWRSTHHEEAYLPWKKSLVFYKNKLRQTRTAYFSALIEENKHNPKFLFSTVAKLTQNHSSEPSIPLILSSNDFMGLLEHVVGVRGIALDWLVSYLAVNPQ